ncbi:glycosyltransferase [Dyadobacter crusticola]|uniref:glycosyltransferase n=1 Tax=Dyadobacter crusticola TaxID=292407 RepID=UPI00068E4DED|nr:glycosyltransferase [Dyadobacter crusticola]
MLIIGKLPPPIGGVTMHVKRLLENLELEGFKSFDFADLRQSPVRCFLKLCRYKVIHLHISSPAWQFLLALFCRLTFKKLIITYHGNWGRYSFWGNVQVSLSAGLCAIPIVQNKESLRLALKWNKAARLISTFLPSSYIEPLDSNTISQLAAFRGKYRMVVCTNAWNLAFDKNQKETYGISELVTYISKQPDFGLIVSDPSAAYLPYILGLVGAIPVNVLFISTPHDFQNILEVADAFIRNTTTDGVSLSIHEALQMDVAVLATAAVERSPYCRVFNDLTDLKLETEIRKAKELLPGIEIKSVDPPAIHQLISMYSGVLNLNNQESSKKTKA